MMFEVMETSWEELQQKLQQLRKDGSLDQLIQAHNSYLVQVLEKSLLSKSSQNIKKHIDRLLHCIMEFVSAQELLYQSSVELMLKLTSPSSADSSEMDEADDGESSDASGAWRQSSQMQLLNASLPKLQSLQKGYKTMFMSLLSLLDQMEHQGLTA
jgi:Gamma tubulin complex component C-terminal